MNQRFRSPGGLLLLLAWWACSTGAEARYAFPEIEDVPTSRLIANLEKRFASQTEESDQYRVGEEIKIWAWNRRALDGTYTVETNGCIQLPEVGTLKVVGRTREDLMRELNGTTDSRSKDFRGVYVEQAWHQRKGRLLPGERAELDYELARVYSIAYARQPRDFQALKGGDRPFLGFGADRDLPSDRRQFRTDSPAPGTPRIEMDPEQSRTNLQAAVHHFREALRLATNHLAAQIGLAWCLDQQGKMAEARRGYERALELAWQQEKGQKYVKEFRPKIVYPYHCRGSDLAKFKQLVGSDAGVEVRLANWYAP